MNLDQFVNRKVTVRFRNGFTATGTLFRSPYSKDYPYIFENNFYTRRGEILIDKLSKYDIVSIQPTNVTIQPTEEPKMTDPQLIERIAEILFKHEEVDCFETYDNLEGLFVRERPELKNKYENMLRDNELKQREEQIEQLRQQIQQLEKETQLIREKY